MDGQLHYLSQKSASQPEIAPYPKPAKIPSSNTVRVKSGDNLSKISQQYGIPLQVLEAANRQLPDFNSIYPGQIINIPTQAYQAEQHETLSSISETVGLAVHVLEYLNNQLSQYNTIPEHQLVKVPATQPSESFAYTLKPNDTLSHLAATFGVSLFDIEDLNPQIQDFDLVYPGQTIRVPIYSASTCTGYYDDTCPICATTESGVKPRAVNGAKFIVKKAEMQSVIPVTTTTIEIGKNVPAITAIVPASEPTNGTVSGIEHRKEVKKREGISQRGMLR
jgi:LysM repeat protein